MRKTTQFISLLLAVVMLCGIALPLSASADTVLSNIEYNCRVYSGEQLDFDVPFGSHTELFYNYWDCSDGSRLYNGNIASNQYSYTLYLVVEAQSGYSFAATPIVKFNGVTLNDDGNPAGSFRIMGEYLHIKVKFNYLTAKDENGANVAPYQGFSGFYISGEIIPFSTMDTSFENGHFSYFTRQGDATLKSTTTILNNQVTMGKEPSTLIAHYVKHTVERAVVKKSKIGEDGAFKYVCKNCAFQDWETERRLPWVDMELEGFDDGVRDSKPLYYNGKNQRLGVQLSFEGRPLDTPNTALSTRQRVRK